MVISVDTSASQSPNLSSGPRFLVLDDNFMKGLSVVTALQDAGYLVELACNPGDAARKLAEAPFDFAIVDGDLGDRRWDADGMSGRFIREHLGAIPYGRYSGSPERVPETLRGRFAFEFASEVRDWVVKNLPLDPPMPESMPRPIAESGSLETIEGEATPARRTFPDIAALGGQDEK